VKGYDGDNLWFNIKEDEAEDNFKEDCPPKEREYSRYKSASATQQYEDSIVFANIVSKRGLINTNLIN
jgi:hypothetical protein